MLSKYSMTKCDPLTRGRVGIVSVVPSGSRDAVTMLAGSPQKI